MIKKRARKFALLRIIGYICRVLEGLERLSETEHDPIKAS